MARFQRGSLRIESRKKGPTWVLRHFVTRQFDGRRVEHKLAVGLVHDLPTQSAAWTQVEKQHLQSQINQPDLRTRVTFADLARHYMEHELGEQTEAVDPKSHTTIAGYKRILKNRCLDRWGKRNALSIEPLEIERWLRALKREQGLENLTLDKTRRVMSLVYKHGQRYGLIPRTEEANPMRFVRCKTTSGYEAMILTPQQAFDVLGSSASQRARLRSWLLRPGFASQNVWACSGRMSASSTRRFTFAGLGRVARLECRKARLHRHPCRCTLCSQSSCKRGRTQHPTRSRLTGCSRPSGAKAASRVPQTCWSRTISDQQRWQPGC